MRARFAFYVGPIGLSEPVMNQINQPRRTSVVAKLGATTIGVLLLVGCQTTTATKVKQPTPSEEARAQWNAARASVLFNMAEEQFHAGSYQDCRETLTNALKMDDKSEPLHLLSARLAVEEGRLEAAVNELETCAQLNADDAEVDYLRGVIYQRWQRSQSALECYQNAGKKRPAELVYLMAQAETLVTLDRTSEALAMLQAKVAYFEHSAAIRDEVGQLLMQQGQVVAAVDMLRQASIVAEDDQDIREHYALALYRSQNYAECITTLQRLLKDTKHANRADLNCALGQCQLSLGNTREAQLSFEKAQVFQPADVGIRLFVARAAIQAGETRRAESALKKALVVEPNSSEGHLLLGYLRFKQRRYPDALVEFQKASELDTRDTISLCMVGLSLQKQGKLQEAAENYRRALKIRPTDEMACRLMAGIDANE